MKPIRKTVIGLCAALMCLCILTCFTGCKSDKQDQSIHVEGQTTVIEHPKKKAADYSPKEQVYVLAGALQNAGAYQSEVIGETKSSFYTQKIHDIHIKNGTESYLKAVSTSSLVKVGKEAYFLGDKVVMREAEDVEKGTWSDDYAVITLDDYRDTTGSTPLELSNYIMNDDTITGAETTVGTDGTYTVTVHVDTEKGTPRYGVKMMNYGHLSSIPLFSDCTLVINFNEDWTINYLESSDTYKIHLMGLKIECRSYMKETFTYPDSVEIPNAAAFRDRVGDEISGNGRPDTVTGKDLLLQTIMETDFATGVGLGGRLILTDRDGKTFEVPVDAWAAADDELGLHGRIRLGLNQLSTQIMFTGDGWLYVEVGTTRYKYKMDPDDLNGVWEDIHDGQISMEKFDRILSLIEIEETGTHSSLETFEVRLIDEGLEKINAALEKALSGLPDEVGDLRDLKNLRIRELKVEIQMSGQDGHGHIESMVLSCDTDRFTVAADALLCARHEELPHGDALESYIEGNGETLGQNLGMIGQIISLVSACDWENGVDLILNVGCDPDIILPFPTKIQITEDGFRAHAKFAMGALLKLPTDFFVEDGTLYVATLKGAGAQAQMTITKEVDLASFLLSKLPSLSLPADTDLFAVLVDALMNSTVETTTLEDGTRRQELILSEDLTRVVEVLYHSLWDMIGQSSASQGAQGDLVTHLATVLNRPLDTIRVRLEQKPDGTLTLLSIRMGLTPAENAPETPQKHVVLGLEKWTPSKLGVLDGLFEQLHNAQKPADPQPEPEPKPEPKPQPAA